MDSESSQDVYFFLKDGEKDLMAYEEEDMLAFEEAADSNVEDRSETMIPGKKPSPSPRLDADAPDVGLMPPVDAAHLQPEELKAVNTFATTVVDFDFQEFSMPSPKVLLSQGGDPAGAVKSHSKLPDVGKVPASPQIEDSESGDHTNALPESIEVPNEPSYPPKEAKQDVGHHLQLFQTDQMVFHAISIREGRDTCENGDHNWMIQEHVTFNGIDIACQLLEAAAAQMEPNVIVNESTVMAIANGLQLSMEYGAEVGNPLIVGIGRLVADILLDSQTGIVLGFAVARLVPHPVINSSGGVQGSVLHQVTRGFAIDDNSRRIITEAVGSAIMMVNQISIE